jgi:teichuronic acid biosynthesis glycosyltransferase TuaH
LSGYDFNSVRFGSRKFPSGRDSTVPLEYLFLFNNRPYKRCFTFRYEEESWIKSFHMTLKNKTVVILGAAKFDGPYESTSYTTAKYLAKSNQVFYADYPYTWKDYYKAKDSQSVEVRRAGFRLATSSLLPTELPGLKVLILPLMLSINFLPEGYLYRLLLAYNEKLIVSRIKSVLNSSGVTDFIFINSFNFHYPNVGRLLKPKLYVYHCVDPLVIEHDRKHGTKSELLINKEANLVICTSKQLYKDKILMNPNTYFIPNAADLTHSGKALDPMLPVHPLITQIPNPIVGYFGNIERRIDFKLLNEVVKLNPDKSFVFVGPVDDDYIDDNFKQLENVYFVGRLPYDEMPSVLKGFDVCMIPFKKDEHSATIFPLKLFEYLGAAKPVVATNFNNDLKDFTLDVIPYCSTSKAFSEAISRLLLENDEQHSNERLEIAKMNTWDIRLNQLSEILGTFYDKKNS